MSEQSDFNLPEEIEGAVKLIFSNPKPDPTFVDRLGHQLSDQVEQFTTPQRKVLITTSSLAWGAIGLMCMFLLVWGIKTLLPRIEPTISSQSTPTPSSEPSIVPTQAEGGEGVIQLPTTLGEPVPWPEEALTSKNASQITELARWDKEMISAVAWSPNGRIIAASMQSGQIKLLDANTGQELRTLTGHTKGVSRMAFSPDGAKLASGSQDTTTRLWDVASGEELAVMDGVKSFGWLGGAPSVDFSPDGKLLAFSGPYGQVKVWDITNHVQLHILGGQEGSPTPNEATGVAFSPDGMFLVSGYINGSIIVWDPLSGQELRTLRKQSYSSNGWIRGISDLQFSPDGKTLAASCWDNEITLWDVTTWSELRTSSLSIGIFGLDFSPNGDVLAIGNGNVSFTIFDAGVSKELNTLDGYQGLAFSPDGKVIINGSWDGAIHLWGIAPPNTAQPEAISPSTEENIVSIATTAPKALPEDIGMEKILLPVLLTGENLQPGSWSPDGNYFSYTDLGSFGEPGPDQAIKSLSLLDTRTGETCPSIQETLSFTQTEFGSVPEGIDLCERTLWSGDNHLLYISPAGDLLALTPCGDASNNWSVSLPDSIVSFSQSNSAGASQIVLKGEKAYWLLTPSTHQSLKLELPSPVERMEISFAWSDWVPKLISSRIEDRQGKMWIILESIDTVTGSVSLITEILASAELENKDPMSAGIERISKDQISITDSLTGSKIYNISSKTIQVANPLSDLFGIEPPDIQEVNGWGSVGDHEILDIGGIAGGQYYIYHPESGKVDKYSLDTPLLIVFPNGEGGIVQSSESSVPSNNTYKVILVDSGLDPYELVVKGFTRQDTWAFATILPDAQRVMFSSEEGISLVDLMSGEILNFWVFENQAQYIDFTTWLSPDGKTVVGFASAEWYTNQAMYWLRLEP